MPSVNIEDNIKKLQNKLEDLTQDLFRTQGVLSTFQGFRDSGLEVIQLPDKKTQDPPLKSIQEKPE